MNDQKTPSLVDDLEALAGDDFDKELASPVRKTREEIGTNVVTGDKILGDTRYADKKKDGERRFPCKACNGTGIIEVYRRGGGYGQIPSQRKCWKGCKGTGFLKTSPEQRKKARDAQATRKEHDRNAVIDAADAFLEANPDICKWLDDGRNGNPKYAEFPRSLYEKLYKYGEWTPGQLAAAEKAAARYASLRKEWAAEREQDNAESEEADLDISNIPSGYYAVPNGETRLKVRVNVVKKGKWIDWIFVDDGAEYGQRQKYGSQRPEGTYKGKIVDQLKAIAEDPIAASKAYGNLVGRCGVCNRLLEDEKSIELGIGPVCLSRLETTAGE